MCCISTSTLRDLVSLVVARQMFFHGDTVSELLRIVCGFSSTRVCVYHPKLLVSCAEALNHSLQYTLSAGADAHMMAVYASTVVATQDPSASHVMS